ncbi:MAG TPA: TetR/AcrR family transcriptional regulator [Alphaproteobacteria bacterium]|jgi:AcrR family transcriptional regulator
MPREPRWDRVLTSAARLFAEDGFAATSVRAVAERARLTKAGLYYHIKEKEDLLFRICEQSIAEILDGARAALRRESEPAVQLAALVRNHAEFFFRHPHNLTVLNRDMGALTGAQREGIRALEMEYLELIRDVFRHGQKRGAFKKLDPTVAAFGFLGVLNTLDRWYDAAGPVKPETLVEQIETMLMRGALAEAPRRREP